MQDHRLRRRVAASRLALVAAFPVRLRAVARHDADVVRSSVRWLFTSREHTNFNYPLTNRNLRHLAAWVSEVTGAAPSAVNGYMRELLDDDALRAHVRSATLSSPRRGLADANVEYARRVGWYAIVRATGPELVVETGTDKGLGACVIASALLRNGAGRLVTFDVNPDSGYLVSGPYAAVVDRVLKDSVSGLSDLGGPVDLFLHDSWHSYSHERDEIEAVAPRLSDGALVLSDNADQTDALLDWAEANGWSFHYFAEAPEEHWFPGQGIGLARKAPKSSL